MTSDDKTRTRKTPSRFTTASDELRSAFYDRLFARNPGLRPIFAGAHKPGAKLDSALAHLVHGLDRLETVLDDTCFLTLRQIQYGVPASHYAAVRQVLLEVLEARLEKMCSLHAGTLRPVDDSYAFRPRAKAS